MQYISPFSFLPSTPSSTFTRKDIVLAKRKLLAEFELLGTSTIIHNNKEISRNDVLIFFEELEKSNDLNFHALVASNKELLYFLEIHKVEHHFNFDLDHEKINAEFVEWLSPYYAAAFKDCSYQYFRKLQLPELQVLIKNQSLMTADDRYTSWQPVENYFHSLVQQFEHFNTHEVGGSDEAKISKFTKFEQVDIIALLPTDIFQHLINEYAFEMMRSSIDVFNRIQNQEWAIIILDNALSLPVDEENKIQLINKKNEMQDIMSKPTPTYSSPGRSSGNNDSTWAIVRIIAFAIFFIYRLSTCNETTSYNADKFNSSNYYGNYTELIEKARKQTEFNSKVANHRINQDTSHQILDESKDADGYLSDSGFIENCLPWLNETKYIDTTDISDIYCLLDNGNIKANAYTINESGERLQLFIVNENSLDIDSADEDILLSQKNIYEKQFNRAISFIKKSIKKQLDDHLQNASPTWVLVHQLGSSLFIDQIDVIEIFLLSATATVEQRGNAPTPKSIEFDDESISVSFSRERENYTKDLIIIKRLVDLNFLYNVHIAQGSRYPLVIDFSSSAFNHLLPCLHAASEENFDSYFCAIPATLLAELYRRHSSRLLEKNVRSFLQLKGVNKGMQDTIKKEPERFIAYNNGLTITATDNEIKNINGIPHIKSLSDFQIVNGGQTTATLYFSQKAGHSIDKISVMAKINVAKDASEDILDDLISSISTFSNAQSKVSKVDLRARSPQLVKLKSLSESILTISGKKWFFERAKGEYATLLRINSSRKNQIEKAFPKERRFTKEELAKYFEAWGEKPYAVKKGGEKIFRLFIEEISGEGRSKKGIPINRTFYEDLIARIILFRSLEKSYGAGNNALGQLRSAVVPYSLSTVFAFTTGNKKNDPFDLLKIWKTEKLDDDLLQFFRALMQLMNDLIKKYSKSDDLGEYSKKVELWEDIISSKEIASFMSEHSNKQLLKRYSVSAEEFKKREKEAAKDESLNFEPLLDSADIFDRGAEFYKSILYSLSDELSDSKVFKINEIIAAIKQNKTIEENYISFERELLKKISVKHPEILSRNNGSDTISYTANFIMKKYNSAISNNRSIQATFDFVKEQANKKGARFYSIFGEIGKMLENNTLPNMQQIKQASEYCKLLSSGNQ